MIDYAAHYNNQMFSDITIKLKNGSIPAHKIVLFTNGGTYFRKLLSGENKENNEGVITFPRDDAIVIMVIKYLYGLPIVPEDDNEWLDLMQFAHSINLQSMIDSIGTMVPESLPIDLLIDLSLKTNIVHWLNESVDRLMIGDSILTSEISYDDYSRLRSAWKGRGHSQYRLFLLDCNYCQSVIDQLADVDPASKVIEFMNEIIPTINFSTFSASELEMCTTFPLVQDIPMLKHLFSMMPKSRPYLNYEESDKKNNRNGVGTFTSRMSRATPFTVTVI